MKNPSIQVYPDKQAVGAQAALLFVEAARSAIEARGQFLVCLSGGSTPKVLFQILAQTPYRHQVDWEKTFVFWGDERSVPFDHPDNNAQMASENLLALVPVPDDQVFPMNGADDPKAGAEAYESTLRYFFKEDGPTFDLLLLGMGDDGHTASLFPGTSILSETEKWVDAVFVEKFDTWRISLTAPFIRRARNIQFLVTGDSKAPALLAVLEGPENITTYPSQLINKDNPNVLWLTDETAAARLSL